jgi:hypothetical protein
LTLFAVLMDLSLYSCKVLALHAKCQVALSLSFSSSVSPAFFIVTSGKFVRCSFDALRVPNCQFSIQNHIHLFLSALMIDTIDGISKKNTANERRCVMLCIS